MTPGKRADRTLTDLHHAAGNLGEMVTKRTLLRWRIKEVINMLETAVADLKTILGETAE